MGQVAIMNYITQEIHIFNVDLSKNRDVDISELGFRDSDCHYMCSDNEIQVIQHKGIVK